MSKIVDTGKEVVKQSGNGILALGIFAIFPIGYFVLSLMGPVPDAVLGGVGLPEVNGTSAKMEAQIRKNHKKLVTKVKTFQVKQEIELLKEYVVTGFTEEVTEGADGPFSVIQLEVISKDFFTKNKKKEFMQISSDFTVKKGVIAYVYYDVSNRELAAIMPRLAVDMNGREISYFYPIK